MRPLNDEEVSAALASLAHWEHRDGGLARFAPTDDPDGLASAVDRVLGGDGGHVAAIPTQDGLVLRVATPGAGVTALDVEVAARIEQAIEMGGADARLDPP